MSKWALLYRVVRVKICSLARVVPKGNGHRGVAAEREGNNYTSPGGEEDRTSTHLPFLVAERFPTSFFCFFSFPSLSEFVCKPFSLRGCEEPFCMLYCNPGAGRNPFKPGTKSAH